MSVLWRHFSLTFQPKAAVFHPRVILYPNILAIILMIKN